jgi:hypothetical protein
LVKWFLNGSLVKMMIFSEIYIEKEQIAVQKNDQATRKSPAHINWFRVLGLFMYKEDPLILYKIEFALELVNWFLNGRLVKTMYYKCDIYKWLKFYFERNRARS